MKYIFFVLITSLFFLIETNAQINASTQGLLPNRTILESTFNIFYGSVNGSAFAVNGGKSQYLITAKHLFGNAVKEDSLVEVQVKGGKFEKSLKGKIYYHSNPRVDIAVLKLDTAIASETVDLGKGKYYYLAQECLFLGFPLFGLGTKMDIGKFPFVKRAIISAFYEENGVTLMLLDGHNNPGFSGGPVVTFNENISKLFIVGIISGYVNQSQSVNFKIGTETSQLLLNENSGIIISYECIYIQEIIDKIEKGY
jgi:S1-C subfamily serine protease